MTFMKPIETDYAPTGKDWVYEVKYDGFRGRLQWHTDRIKLKSRNGHDMSALFPEIIGFCQKQQSAIQSLLPLEFDGELAVLNHSYQANFPLIQQRGRLKKSEKIEHAAMNRPATFLAFDIIQKQGEALKNTFFRERKKTLWSLFKQMQLPTDAVALNCPLCYVPSFADVNNLWDNVFENKGEGVVAKQTTSLYQPSKNHEAWYKVKNWRTIEAFLTFYHTANDYFTAAVYESDETRSIGKCKHGLNENEEQTLKTLFTEKGEKQKNGYALPPAICAQIHTLDLYKEELREPGFEQILEHGRAADCTDEKLRLDLAMLPKAVETSNTEKDFWPESALTKGDLLIYMREIASFMLPFLKDRVLTVIRSPDGIGGESFFQKHRPDDAPGFIPSFETDGETFIVCNHLEPLIWLANQGAIEYHTPFEGTSSDSPSEIVFDLDPPDITQFPLAVKAARMLKQLLDDLELTAFVKTSGNTGMQVHIPIPSGSMSYSETAVLTKAIAETMENARPDLFTTERLKRNRKGRLYIDYLQHAKGKTIIAPYSPRLTETGSVATPLFWEEVTPDLHPASFTIENVVRRVQTEGCPFAGFFEAGRKQQLANVKKMIRS